MSNITNQWNRLKLCVSADRLAAAGLALFAGAVYLSTLCPTVYLGDSGDLSAAALTAGIAHAPGYPLFVLTGYLFSLFIPGKGSAFDINLLCAIWAAASVAVLFGLLRRTGCRRTTAAAAALVFGLINPFWSQAVAARVYPLMTLLMISAVYCLIRYEQTRLWCYCNRYMLFLGLGLANNPLAVLTIPVFLLFVLTIRPAHRLSVRTALSSLLWLAPGLLLYAYLPLRSMTDPVIHWGKPGVERNLLMFILRHSYMGRGYVQTVRDALEVAGYYLRLIPAEFTLVGAVCIVIGIYAGWRRSWRLTLGMLTIAVLNVLLMIVHSPHPDIFFWPRYALPFFLSAAIFFAHGVQAIVARIPWEKAHWAVFLIPLALVFSNYTNNDRSRIYLAYDYSMCILSTLPENAHLVAFGQDNITFPLVYLHRVMGVRPDIRLYTPGMHPGDLPADIEADTPVFTTNDTIFIEHGKRTVPYGLVFRVVTDDVEPPLFTEWDSCAVRNAGDPPSELDYTARVLLGNYYCMRAFNALRINTRSALPYLDAALRAGYDVVSVQITVGTLLERFGMHSQAQACFERARAINRYAQAVD